MTERPEHGSEKLGRWWPYIVGLFGMALIVLDAIVFPPPDTTTMSAGVSCIVGFGAVQLLRSERRPND